MTTTRPNRTWVLDTRAMGRSPGTMRPVTVTIALVEPIGTGVMTVPARSELQLTLRLEAVTEGVLVSGTASGTAQGQCSRCLADIERGVLARLLELYAYPGSATAATTGDDEVMRLIDDEIDLLPLVRDEILLALPGVPVCRAECAGLCPDCGERLDDVEPGHHHETIDPRWAALADRLPTGAETFKEN